MRPWPAWTSGGTGCCASSHLRLFNTFFVAAALLLCSLGGLGPLPAEGLFPGLEPSGNSMDEVAIGMFILNLGAVDALGGTFEADFYLYCTGQKLYSIDVSKAQGYFPNAVKGLTMWEVDKMPGRVNSTTQFRVQSKFYFTVDNSMFPFERHRLEIVFEDPVRVLTELVYTADNSTSGMSQAIHFPGFSRTSLSQSMLAANFTYPYTADLEPKVFSRIIFVMDLTRPFSNAIMKGVLPPFFLLLVLSFNTLLPLKHITNRITVAGTVLVSAVMYHANLENQTPPTGKLSIADEIMISTYFLITFNFSGAIVILLLSDRSAVQAASDVQWMCIVVQWVCTPLTFLFSVFLGQPSFLAVILLAGSLSLLVYLMKHMHFLRAMKRMLDPGFDFRGPEDEGRGEQHEPLNREPSGGSLEFQEMHNLPRVVSPGVATPSGYLQQRSTSSSFSDR
mmetsp:Transcript_2068/g.6132  ORF Transcript_2068/g.6132 Transcript_2068/m.6132 type:complete len:449 (+) Transcript_2068:159-1505(+)